MALIIFLTAAYLLGSVPFGLVVARYFSGTDIRESGSGNIGATNVARLCGTKYGVLTLALDLAKGFVPVVLAGVFIQNGFALSLVGLAAICGHCWPVFLDFRGGKAVSTAIGAFLALAPWALIPSALLCVLVIALSGFISMGSFTLAVSLPVFCLLTGHISTIPAALVFLCILFWRHRDNMVRLAAGEEKPWFTKKERSSS